MNSPTHAIINLALPGRPLPTWFLAGSIGCIYLAFGIYAATVWGGS